jgi:hypothetical protein
LIDETGGDLIEAGGGDRTGSEDGGLSATGLSPAADERVVFANELAVGAKSRDEVESLDDEVPAFEDLAPGVNEAFIVPILPTVLVADILAEDRRVPTDETWAELPREVAPVPSTDCFREVTVVDPGATLLLLVCVPMVGLLARLPRVD